MCNCYVDLAQSGSVYAPMPDVILLTCANQLQIIRLIGDRPMAKGTDNSSLLQKKHARHLLRIFLNQADSILKQRTLEPTHQDRRIQRMQIGLVRDKPKAGA